MTGVQGRENFCKCDRWAYIETPTFFPRPHRAQINVSPITLSPSPRPTCLPAKQATKKLPTTIYTWFRNTELEGEKNELMPKSHVLNLTMTVCDLFQLNI